VWLSANRVWFCSEWRAARRDATHVTLATPKARDPAHLSTCTLHVSLAFSPTFSPSRLFLFFSSLLFGPTFLRLWRSKVFCAFKETSESGAHVESGRFFTSTAMNSFSLLTHPSKKGVREKWREKEQTGPTCAAVDLIVLKFAVTRRNFSKFFGETFIFDFFFSPS
jgi:hypothetical protein